MSDIQLIQCKNQQKKSSYRWNIVPYQGNWDQGIEQWCQNFNRKFINGRSRACTVKMWLKIALNAVRLPKFEPVNGKSWSPRKMMVKDLRQRSGLARFCADIQSLTTEIRRGKKERKKEQTTGWKYTWSALLHRATINNLKNCVQIWAVNFNWRHHRRQCNMGRIYRNSDILTISINMHLTWHYSLWCYYVMVVKGHSGAD